MVAMLEITGNIFDYVATHWVVISTNQGWRLNGDNVMGAGLAKYVRDNHPHLAKEYGAFCRAHPGEPLITSYEVGHPDGKRRFVMFPTKRLDCSAPHLSWKARSDIELIEACLPQLVAFGEVAEHPIMVPLLGCSNGGLRYEVVAPLIKRYLTSDIFTLIYETPF